MNGPGLLVVHVIVLLGLMLLIAAIGRMGARLLRLPSVIGEILLSLLLGPVLVALVGRRTFRAWLPENITGLLTQMGNVGLLLFLVGIVYRLDHGSAGLRSRAVSRVTVGLFGLPLLTGLAFSGWLFRFGPAELRGSAPWPALLVLLTVAMSVTAVPVLARIIEERKENLGRSGELTMMSAMVIDTLAWLLLILALGLAAGGLGGIGASLAATVVGVAVAFAGHRALSRPTVGQACARNPRGVTVLLALATVVAGTQAHSFGLTAVFGAFVVGSMIPKDDTHCPWPSMVDTLSRVGRALVPVFFVVTGVTLSTGASLSLPWTAGLLATVLAILGKVGGGYLGARWAGEERRGALRVGVLGNTRGLTEVVVLQVGYSAGILTAGLFVALLVMALVTTCLTGPLLSLIDRQATREVSLVREGDVS
ncbi:cation:proton antiporter [Streptomyces adelaidensis]|uniref:cation:proton antiporter n=1 Tax=Streptomyces adelaidensis TaxID=2796465 RepID=UPI0019067113|nr:cation:proton antiporter [Streptomyces adelaidensis]